MKALFQFVMLTLPFMTVSAQKVFPFHENTHWYFADSNLQRINSQHFDSIIPAERGFFYATKNGKYALANPDGKVLTRIIYTEIYYHRFISKFVGKRNNKTYSITFEGKTASYIESGYCGGMFARASHFNSYTKGDKVGIFSVKQKDGQFYNDSMEAVYDELVENYNGVAFVRVGALWGIINTSGVYLTEPVYDTIMQDQCHSRNFVCGATVRKNNLYGWIDEQRKLLIAPQYKSLTPFRNGYAAVETPNGKSGYVLENGTELFR
jgi:hypothetical protein